MMLVKYEDLSKELSFYPFKNPQNNRILQSSTVVHQPLQRLGLGLARVCR